MPYSTVDGSEVDDCDDDQTAVTKDSDGELMGCHDSEEAAQDQIAALEASEDEDRAVPFFALRSELGDSLERLLPRLGLQTRVDARDMTQTVAGTFWRRFDDMPDEDYVVPEVYVTGASDEQASGWLVAVNRNTDRYWRAGWTYDDSGTGAAEVEYDDPGSWAEVEEQWVPVDAEAERLVDAAAERKEAQNETGDQRDAEGERARADVEAGGDEHRAILQGAELRMSSDGERTTIQFMTEDVARDGLVLDADGLDLSAYRQNPVVLWQHGKDPRRGGQPIAKTVDIARNSDGYLATIEWYDDDFSQEIKRQVKEGYLNAASIGWRTEDLDWDESPPRVAESDMTEFSIVSVPADAGALVEERSGDHDPLTELRDEIESLREEIERLRDGRSGQEEAGHGATAPSPPDATDSSATGDGSAAEDREAAQEERYVRLSDVKALRKQRKKERRETIRTELKKALGMA